MSTCDAAADDGPPLVCGTEVVERCAADGVDDEFAAGRCRLVERLRISFPLTTTLSFDFLRSRVSISEMGVNLCQQVCAA